MSKIFKDRIVLEREMIIKDGVRFFTTTLKAKGGDKDEVTLYHKEISSKEKDCHDTDTPELNKFVDWVVMLYAKKHQILESNNSTE